MTTEGYRRFFFPSNSMVRHLLHRSHEIFAGCRHEFCTRCALYLCSTNSTSTVHGAPGSVACPLCRHAILAFCEIQEDSPAMEMYRRSLPLSLYAGSSSLRSLSCQKFPSMRLNSCMGTSQTRSSLFPCSRPSLRRSSSHGVGKRSWLLATK